MKITLVVSEGTETENKLFREIFKDTIKGSQDLTKEIVLDSDNPRQAPIGVVLMALNSAFEYVNEYSLHMPIESLGLSEKDLKAISSKTEYHLIGELVESSEKDLQRNNLSDEIISNISNALQGMGFCLGTALKHYPNEKILDAIFRA